MNEKLDLKQLLEDLGFSVSVDYEREPNGIAFADVHDYRFDIKGNMSTYQAIKAIEIKLMIIVTDQTYTMTEKAIRALRDDYTIYRNEENDNQLTVILRGGLVF